MFDFGGFFSLQAYIRIYQGDELPHPKSMLQVSRRVFKQNKPIIVVC